MGKVVVAGSINMDVIARVEHLPETGATIHGKSVEYLPGGKGLNQAVAAAKMGVETILVGRLGNDGFADILQDFIKRHNIETDYIKRSDKESGTAFVNVADNGQNTIVVVAGSNSDLKSNDVSVISLEQDDVVISQFEIPIATILALFTKAKAVGARTILNPSPIQPIPDELLSVVDVLIVNEAELAFVKGKSITAETPLAEVAAAAEQIKLRPSQAVIVTLGSKGALVAADNVYFEKACKVCAIDTVGAGDCFAGVIASELVQGKTLRESVRKANKAASICVTRKGAAPAMPNKNEL